MTDLNKNRPGYKKTKVGWVPEVWDYFPLGRCVRIKHGYAFKSSYFSSKGNFIVLTPGNFYENGGFRSRQDQEKYYTADFPKEYLLSKGNLLIAMTEQASGLLGTVSYISDQAAKLPQLHANVWDLFESIKGTRDPEVFENHLRDEERRNRFYERFSLFARTLALALSSTNFLETIDRDTIDRYKRDLYFFQNLRAAVTQRFQETIRYSEYEPKIKKLIDSYVPAGDVVVQTALPLNSVAFFAGSIHKQAKQITPFWNDSQKEQAYKASQTFNIPQDSLWDLHCVWRLYILIM